MTECFRCRAVVRVARVRHRSANWSDRRWFGMLPDLPILVTTIRARRTRRERVPEESSAATGGSDRAVLDGLGVALSVESCCGDAAASTSATSSGS